MIGIGIDFKNKERISIDRCNNYAINAIIIHLVANHIQQLISLFQKQCQYIEIHCVTAHRTKSQHSRSDQIAAHQTHQQCEEKISCFIPVVISYLFIHACIA